MQKITPFLWFDGKAEEAARFYVSIFRNSRIINVQHLPEGPAKGNAIVEFELEGQRFTALDGGPYFTFTPAISFVVDCLSQEEVDEFWEKLSAGGEKEQCGWIRDRFGISWQIVPSILPRLMSDPVKAPQVMRALLKMTKLDIRALQEAGDAT